jgi:peptidoglycan/LPS O-acetylase OafA/YrhL
VGTTRLLFALAVVAGHSGGWLLLGSREVVLLFYMISGFYMAMVLNTKYVGTNSIKKFYISRFLKIFIPHLVVMTLFVFTAKLVGFPTVFDQLSKYATWFSAATVLSNLTIFGQDLFYLFSIDSSSQISYIPIEREGWNGANFSINSVLFSVSFELYFYLLAPFILRAYSRTVAFTVLGFLWHAVLAHLNYKGLDLKYHSFPSTFLFFGLGASTYWMHSTHEKKYAYFFNVLLFLVLFSLSFVNLLTHPVVIAFFFFAIPSLFAFSKDSKIDRLLGELSYPVYLVHLPLVLLFRQYFGDQVFLIVALLSLLFAFVFHWIIERPLSTYRLRFSDNRI